VICRKGFVLLLFVTVLFTRDGFSVNHELLNSHKSEVLVVGTVHQRHSTDTNYTYRHLFNILSAYNPDIVCVEIRPIDFRKEQYLDEMMMATIWAITNGKKAYPIDWWTNGNVRQVRDSLLNLPEYKKKEQEYEALEAKDTIISNFEKRYGKWEDQGQQGYEFWNGKEYNEYWMEDYRLSMQVFGDSPFNLYYRTRNDSMMALISLVIRQNPGRRVIVLTGAEHKHYFDNILERNPDVSLIDFHSILPFPEKDFDPALKSFFDDANDLPYYEDGYPRDMNEYYREKLIPLIHGPDMDFNPDIVPAKNILKAEKVIARWKKEGVSSSESDIVDFELGWLDFLKRDYREAIGYLSSLSQRIEAGAVKDPFLRAITHRNLGLCYDCIGERDSAIVCYKRGEELASTTSFARVISFMFKNYKEQPYRPEHH
jgi:tetratricopeptide (TPR) repeat protein